MTLASYLAATKGRFFPKVQDGSKAMSGDTSRLDELIHRLKQQRDELAVKIHLAKAEAKEEWSKVDDKFAQLKADYKPVKDAVGETAKNVLSALELAAGEVKAGFDRVRKLL